MLVESIVRKTLGINLHRATRVEERDGALWVYLQLHANRLVPCGACGKRGRVRDRLAPRTWKHMPLWGMPVRLVYAPTRVKCAHCTKTRVEAIPWSQGKCRLSKPLIWVLASLCKWLPWEQVARLYQVHWNTVAAAVKQAVSYGLERRELGGVQAADHMLAGPVPGGLGEGVWKEKIQLFWEYTCPTAAHAYLRRWCKGAMRSRLPPLKKFVGTMRGHEDIILNWFEAKKLYSSGAVEGMNRRINLILRLQKLRSAQNRPIPHTRQTSRARKNPQILTKTPVRPPCPLHQTG